MDVAVGIDRFHAKSQHVDFWFAKFAIQSVELAIGISDADVIEVDECEFPNARAGKRFNGPGTDAAKTDNADVGARDSFQAFRRIQARKTIEAGKIRSAIGFSYALARRGSTASSR